MTYTDFTLESVVARFAPTLHMASLLSQAKSIAVPESLSEQIAEGRTFFLGSEKARSEFIVAPILLAVRRLSGCRVAVYSGFRFDIDASAGLVGECDFLISAANPVPLIQAPIISIIQAKSSDIEAGYGPCAAQMIAAQHFHKHSAVASRAVVVYGCVTTGTVWRFLRLQDNVLTFDNRDVYLSDLGLILGRFAAIVDEAAPHTAAAPIDSSPPFPEDTQRVPS